MIKVQISVAQSAADPQLNGNGYSRGRMFNFLLDEPEAFASFVLPQAFPEGAPAIIRVRMMPDLTVEDYVNRNWERINRGNLPKFEED